MSLAKTPQKMVKLPPCVCEFKLQNPPINSRNYIVFCRMKQTVFVCFSVCVLKAEWCAGELTIKSFTNALKIKVNNYLQ